MILYLHIQQIMYVPQLHRLLAYLLSKESLKSWKIEKQDILAKHYCFIKILLGTI